MMKKLVFALIALWSMAGLAAGTNYVKYVNPMIGTDNHGHVAIGANVPFGLVNMGPVEVGQGWDWCSGYNYADSLILGFSPLHLSGTGCSDLGDIIVMPTTGKVTFSRGQADKPKSGHFSPFKHENEVAQAGYYSVMLDRWNIRAEMTATDRVAWQRYSWPTNANDQRVVFDLRNSVSDEATDCEIHKVDDYTIAGHRTSTGWAAHHTVYFVAKFSRPIAKWTVAEDNHVMRGKALRSSHAFGEAKFASDGSNELVVQLAISPVSEKGALANLQAETEHLSSFDAVKEAAQARWNQWLGTIDAEMMSDADMTVFYTALYHMMIAPQTYSDVDGGYAGSDGKIYNDPSFKNYTTWSCWDTYRSYHPLATLIFPQLQQDWANALLHINKEQGYLPIWHLMNNETHCMVGISSVPILADMCLKGYVPQNQLEDAFQALKGTMMSNEKGLKYMRSHGYLPNTQWNCVSKTMEYCLDDWAVAQVAKKLGHTDDYNYFYNRSLGYKKLYDPQTRYFRSRDVDGNFGSAEGFKPNYQTEDYTEGNPWQYLWLAPHDVGGLVTLLGGEKTFTERLDSLFIADSDLGDKHNPDIAGLIGQYAHGNEPSHHIAYLYNYVGHQEKTASMVRQIMTTMYGDTKDGLAGNEDVGQMSAWYVISALGLYQVEPCGGVYQFGSPMVKKASFKTASGKTFTIITHDNSAENIHIKKVKRNGKTYKKTFITFDDINAGGTLEFFMGK